MEIPSPDSKSITNALWVEHHVQRIITQQEENGVLFDSARARLYIRILQRKQQRLYEKIRPSLSLELSVPYDRPVSKPFLKSGDYNATVTKWFSSEEVHRVSGPFTRVEFVEPDLGKRAKLCAQLIALGWRPAEYTPKGGPKLTVDGQPCPSLQKIGDGIGKWIANWYTYRHRESQITGWLEHVRPDGRLSAEAITIGTPTFRFRHRVVVNIPKAKKHVLFGFHMRKLFTVPKGKKMVGFDASGLELRMLADAINDILYTKEVINGDIHTKNQKDAGLPTRDNAKTFIYAFIYGAGDAKIGSIIGGSRNLGRQVRSRFLRANPKLAECIKTTQDAAGRGWLVGLDGRKILLRRDPFTGQIQTHKALNTRLQTAGAVVMKWAMVILDLWLQQMDLDAMKVIDMHDEAQWEVAEKDAEVVGMLGVQAIVEAGRMLKLNVPLAGEYKIGNSWASTH
jgi:hypothetical protein